jgi:hypothetical protein
MRTWDEECDVCDVLQEYDGRLEKISEWAGAVSGNANMLIKKDKTQNCHAMKVHVGGLSKGVVGWILDAWEQEGGAQAITDPYEGKDLIMKREKFNGKFDIKAAFSSSSIAESQEEIDSILANIVNLDKVFKAPDDDVRVTVREAATKLRDTIENLIMNMTGNEEGQVPGHDPDEPLPTFTAEEVASEEGEATNEGEEEVQDPPPPPPKKTTTVARPTGNKPAATVAKPTVTRPAAAAPKAGTTAKVQPKTQTAVGGKPAGTTAKPGATNKVGTSVSRPNGAATTAKPVGTVAKPGTTAKGTTAAPKVAPKTGKMKADTPADAPECFADANVHNEDSEVCLECPHEFACKTQIEAAGA